MDPWRSTRTTLVITIARYALLSLHYSPGWDLTSSIIHFDSALFCLWTSSWDLHGLQIIHLTFVSLFFSCRTDFGIQDLSLRQNYWSLYALIKLTMTWFCRISSISAFYLSLHSSQSFTPPYIFLKTFLLNLLNLPLSSYETTGRISVVDFCIFVVWFSSLFFSRLRYA